MAGHNKWSKIKRKKGANDQKRGALFAKLVKEITIAAKQGGGDISANARLRTAVDEGKSQGLPKDNIERAIKKGCGELGEDIQLEEIIYEGFGPHGVAVLVDCITDNRLRTQPEVRKLFEKGGGQIAEKGAVSWGFKTRGQILVNKEAADEESVMNAVLEAGAEDINPQEEGIEVLTEPHQLSKVKDALEQAHIKAASAEITHIPGNTVDLSEEQAEQVENLVELLEDHDDVQRVTTNAD
jgi:YebC/PmpR family DNA-binding regulatory protein